MPRSPSPPSSAESGPRRAFLPRPRGCAYRRYSIDIQILGIGRNGHIAFNEPGTPFGSLTHKVQLTESTIKANSRFFDNEDEVPRQAICMGIKSIMQSKKIVLLAFGESKQDAVKALVEGPVTEEVPASILQDHPDVTVICDEVAAAKLDPKYRN